MSFQLFLEFKQQQQFNKLFEELCQKIVLSNIPFQQYWENNLLPILLEGNYQNENELLLEFSFRNMFGYDSKPTIPDPLQIRGPNGEVTNTISKDNPNYGKLQDRQQQSNKLAQQLTNQVKQSFSGYLQKFQQSMHQKAISTNNAHIWKATQLFINKIKPIIDQFTLNSTPVKQASYRNDFKDFQKQHGQQQNVIGQQRQNAKTTGMLNASQAQGRQAMANRKQSSSTATSDNK